LWFILTGCGLLLHDNLSVLAGRFGCRLGRGAMNYTQDEGVSIGNINNTKTPEVEHGIAKPYR
jgi:hypothetical protein